jgi:hypothetical protein
VCELGEELATVGSGGVVELVVAVEVGDGLPRAEGVGEVDVNDGRLLGGGEGRKGGESEDGGTRKEAHERS